VRSKSDKDLTLPAIKIYILLPEYDIVEDGIEESENSQDEFDKVFL
jgi:hypothetical protein